MGKVRVVNLYVAKCSDRWDNTPQLTFIIAKNKANAIRLFKRFNFMENPTAPIKITEIKTTNDFFIRPRLNGGDLYYTTRNGMGHKVNWSKI